MLQMPSSFFQSVTPADGTDLPNGAPQAVVATVAGVIAMYPQGTSTTSVLVPVAAGIPVYVSPRRILATGTTATGLVALY